MSSVLAATPRSRLRMGSEDAGGALWVDNGCCGRWKGWKPGALGAAEGEGGARVPPGVAEGERLCRRLPGWRRSSSSSARWSGALGPPRRRSAGAPRRSEAIALGRGRLLPAPSSALR
jgi:hypothetical protein